MRNDVLSLGGFLSGLSCGLWFGIDSLEKLLAVILIGAAAVILLTVGLASKKFRPPCQALCLDQGSRLGV